MSVGWLVGLVEELIIVSVGRFVVAQSEVGCGQELWWGGTTYNILVKSSEFIQ